MLTHSFIININILLPELKQTVKMFSTLEKSLIPFHSGDIFTPMAMSPFLFPRASIVFRSFLLPPPSSYSFPLAISVLIPRVLFSCLYLFIAEEKLGKESNV